MSAFLAALVSGADAIELDVHLTRDGHVVVCHDETIDRTSNGHGRIVDQSLQQLRAYSFASGKPGWGYEPIPELDDVLALSCRCDAIVNIELKNSLIRYPGLEQKVVDAVRRHHMADRVVISSFNHRSLVLLADLAPDIRRGMLYEDDLVDPWSYAATLKVQAVHPRHQLLSGRDDVPTFHEHGLGVRAWTVNTEQAREAAHLGVDAVITNYPAEVAVAVASGGRQNPIAFSGG
ncbi:Glycerophosphoryl diester phosphodiesterase [Cutibacterium granulosum]|uniref:Glycerophosphoryl diester phosphodiesterase n=2 Tax=Cutibacterium granulosum TaxID=33011 RepID=A0A239W541_9ACTN|nr:Glycerophosphoryl diester phosphodiesterase [Cutibacterium granulosum]